MPYPTIFAPCATLLNDLKTNTVQCKRWTGGYDGSLPATATSEIYNIGRGNHTATLLQDGTLLVAGGFDITFRLLKRA